MTGRRASSSKFLRKGHSLTATTGVALPSSQYQARSLAGSSTTECVLLWMTTFVRSRLDSGRGEVVLTTSLPYEISLSSEQSGSKGYVLTLSTSRRPLIVCTGTRCGRFSNLMEYQAASLTLSRVTMMATPAMLVTVTSCLKSRQAWDRDVCYLRYYSIWSLTGCWLTLLEIRIVASDGLYSTLEDLDYADDLALVAHTHQHIQEKTDRLSTSAAQVGLRINTKKTEVMALNMNNPNPVKLGNDNLQYANRFTYLGSIITTEGGTDEDIKSRLNKAGNTFRMLESVWRSAQYSYITKLKLYKSCVIPTLLYGAECWRITDTDIRKNRYLPYQEPPAHSTNFLAYNYLQWGPLQAMQYRLHF